MFVLQLTHSISPVIHSTPQAKLGKDDFKSIPRIRKSVYSDFECRLLSTYAPYRYGGLPLDKGNRRALLEADHLLFDFLVKIDYSAARMADKSPAFGENDLTLENKNGGLVAEKMRLLGPLLAQLGLHPNVPNFDQYDVIRKLKHAASLSLNQVVRLLGLDSIPELLREPNSCKNGKDAYSLQVLREASAMLAAHFRQYYGDYKMFLHFLFTHNSQAQASPSAIDSRILVPSLTSGNYSIHMQFARSILESSPLTTSHNGREMSIPVTFMLVERECFKAFALSDPANFFSPDNSLMPNFGCTIPSVPAAVRNELRMAGVFSNAVALREALVDIKICQNPARLKAKRNAPSYARHSLEQIFGPVPDLGGIPKFPAGKLGAKETMEALIEANLQMQDVLLAYGPHLEAGLKQ